MNHIRMSLCWFVQTSSQTQIFPQSESWSMQSKTYAYFGSMKPWPIQNAARWTLCLGTRVDLFTKERKNKVVITISSFGSNTWWAEELASGEHNSHKSEQILSPSLFQILFFILLKKKTANEQSWTLTKTMSPTGVQFVNSTNSPKNIRACN